MRDAEEISKSLEGLKYRPGYYECKICEWAFGSDGALVAHWNRAHKPHFCERCGKDRQPDEILCEKCRTQFPDIYAATLKIQRAAVRAEERARIWQQRAQNLRELYYLKARNENWALTDPKFSRPSKRYCTHALLFHACSTCQEMADVFEQRRMDRIQRERESLKFTEQARQESRKTQKIQPDVEVIDLDALENSSSPSEKTVEEVIDLDEI